MRRMLVLILVFILVAITSIAFASWDTVPQPKPAQDIIDALIRPDMPTLDQFGHTERTRVIYNIVKLLEACNGYEIRIAALEKQVELTNELINEVKLHLERQNEILSVDPNEVAE